MGDESGEAIAAVVVKVRWRRVVSWALAAVILHGGIAAGAVAGYVDAVPLPEHPEPPQASAIYYRDGRTVLARVGVTDHRAVPLAAVPVPVRRAVLAAEDRGFYHHPGVSGRSVVRAVWADAHGGRQGASTITQQYVRNAYLSQTRTVQRKAREIALAVKVEQRYTKDEIFERYLNTIYFGRGAYGIDAAAYAYFRVAPERLTVAQGAVLAALIKDPTYLDPAVNLDAARNRWHWILAGMREEGWLDRSAALDYPPVPAAVASGGAGPNGLVVDKVERELSEYGVTSQELRTGGLSVVTTLDPAQQRAALDSVRATLRARPAGLHAALVAVDPATGGVRAYYGGERGSGFFDDASAWRPAAGTFSPLVLAAGLAKGVGYTSRWNGRSPRIFPDRYGVPLLNHDGVQCRDCTLEQAMVDSLNTPYYALAEKIGAAYVRDVAVAAGIPATQDGRRSLADLPGEPRPGRTRADIAIGRYPVAPADLATVYATLAAGGARTQRHFVQMVTDAGGGRRWTAGPVRRTALDPRVTADVSAVLQSVAGAHAFTPGRPAAGKAGTQQWGNTRDNQDAWMAGYTPQLAAVVWLGRPVPGPIRGADGRPIGGDDAAAQLWKVFMSAALHDEPATAFPEAAHVGRTDVGDAYDNPDRRDGTSPIRGPRPVTRTRHQGRYLALTFDDGPSDYTTKVLDLLDRFHVKATFCMVGETVGQYPNTVKRMADSGHALCNHSARHDDLGHAAPAQIRTDLTAVDAAIAGVVPGAVVTYFRAPYGDWGATPEVAAALGHTPLGWTVDPEDWKLPGAAAIVATVEAQVKPGSVILVHDGGGDRQQTLDALTVLIPRLQREGWTFDLPEVTVRAVPTATGAPTPSASPVPASPAPESATSASASPSPSDSQTDADSGPPGEPDVDAPDDPSDDEQPAR